MADGYGARDDHQRVEHPDRLACANRDVIPVSVVCFFLAGVTFGLMIVLLARGL